MTEKDEKPSLDLGDPQVVNQFNQIFSDIFGGGLLPPRRVPLVVARGYRGVGEETHEIRFRRRKICTCGDGCTTCSLVGWTVASETAKIELPKGTDIGAVMRLPGMGDARVHRLPIQDLIEAREGAQRVETPPLDIEVVEEGERADELRAAQRDHEGSLEAEHAKLAVKARRSHAKNRTLVIVAAGAFMVAAIIGVRWAQERHNKVELQLGDACHSGSDCRSKLCLTLDPVPPPKLHESRSDGLKVCTELCRTDADCPSSMTCREIPAMSPPTNLLDTTRLCAPREAIPVR